MKLKNATQHISTLEEERSLVKGCISKINHLLMRIIETCDSSLTVSFRQNLFEKIQHVFAMLNQIQGVSRSRDSAKQGGDEEEKNKKETDRKDNEASGLGNEKDKGKGILKEEIDEDANLNNSKRVKREKRDKELDSMLFRTYSK